MGSINAKTREITVIKRLIFMHKAYKRAIAALRKNQNATGAVMSAGIQTLEDGQQVMVLVRVAKYDRKLAMEKRETLGLISDKDK